MRRILFLSTAFVALGVPALRAQGALGVQGYGYPTGQLSTASLGIGGATGETDPASLLNPAAISTPIRYTFYMQFEPEFRRTTAGGNEADSRTLRFPAFVASGGVGRFTTSLSFSTLLDRTWSNTYSDSQDVGGTVYPSTLHASSNGSMVDTRLAAAYAVNEKLHVGLGIHAITGENRILFGRTFPDSTGIGGVSQASTLNFAGHAFSLGVVAQPIRDFTFGVSARIGGALDVERDGGALAQAKVPSRFGLGATWIGIPNTTLAARFESTRWSQMDGLGSTAMTTFDAQEVGLGIDVLGPRVNGLPTTWRLGLRDRDLPFGMDGEQVHERSYAGGLSLPVSRGRGQLDLTLQRAARSAAGADERSWFLSIGLGIRP